MSSFWDLVGFEYRKILRKKSIIITLLIALVVTMLTSGMILMGDYSIDGETSESLYEGMVKDRAYAKKLAGREIAAELLLEAAAAYKKVPTEVKNYSSTEEYQTYARPYSSIRNAVRNIYDKPIQDLTYEEANDFYNIRYTKQQENINGMNLNEYSKEKLLRLDQQIKKPFIYDYREGYSRFFGIMYTTAILGSFVAAICIAPLFAGEYTSGADQIILSSKHGKKKLIWAKLFTGITLSSAICIALTLITYVQCMLTYGFDGMDAPFQLYLTMSPYPLTMGDVALLFSTCILFATIFTTAMTMFLSAKLKSPFGVITIMSVIIVIPMFIRIPETNVVLYNLFNLMPSNMMEIWRTMSPLLYEVFGMSVQPYIFMPIFAVIVTIILLPFTYNGFKKHQIG